MAIEPRKNIAAMQAYVPPLDGRRAANATLLDFNERTLPPSETVISALKKFAESGSLQVYPEYTAFEDALARYLGVERSYLMLSNGSDNGIDTIIRCYLEAGDKILIPQPSFSMFAHSAHLQGGQIISPSYDLDSGFPLEAVKKELKESKPKIAIICNPNNPTGTVVKSEVIDELVKAHSSTLFLIDEAYYEFMLATSLPLIKKYDNVVVTRTFSKAMGLPSLRFGYVVANPKIITELIKVRGPYAVNMMSVAAATASISDPGYITSYVEEVMNISKPMMEDYYKKRGIKFWASGANFHLIQMPCNDIEARLFQLGVRVRQMKYKGFENTVRISIGTKSNTEKVIQALDQILPTN